ncbi:membrane protein [Streptomyces sp. NRRL F-5727]|uniref:membrane protein n=1 Tax=Streptomyces sp. NRRL F-5727 TaxID=1463871 RepID=UPI0004CA93B5|nr:membrane protein [Streptomyces sp. NRRL F-5727]
MRSALCALGAAAALALLPAGHARAEGQEPDRDFTIEDSRITESSGLAASRAHPGVYWTHNDQDEPRIFAVDSRTGKTVATVTLTGVGTPRDMEAVSVGPDGAVYVGDIGDNLDGSWDHVWIYRFPEPKTLKDQTVRAQQYVVRYADGPRNAEALMVHPQTGRVYIASKNEDGGGLYEGPQRLSASGTNTFRRIGEVPWVTDGAFSPDGQRLLLRGYFSAREYDWKDGRIAGDGTSPGAPFQGQAESVTYTLDGTGMLFGSEGAQSRVVRVDRPDAPRTADPDPGQGAPTPGATPGATPAATDSEGSATKGFLVLAGATVLVFGVKRLLRRD